MIRILPAGVLLLSALLGLAGCVELDLGSTPFFCNNGTPPCPFGYTCVTSGNRRICVKEGLPPPKLDGMAGNGDQGTGPDTGPITDGKLRPDGNTSPDMSVADAWPSTPDQYVWPDLPPPPDKGPKPDVPKLGCQNNKECKTKDPQNPCCCPVTIIWICAPLCLNPLCLPL